MFLVNSRLGLFTAASSRRHPFSRSYGVFLPSSLTRVLPSVLGFSPRLPVSVCGTGTSHHVAPFLASVNSAASILVFCPHHAPALRSAYFTTLQPQRLDGLYHQPALLILLCQCININTRWYRNINLLSIAYDFYVLGLGPDLPRVDEPSSGNLRHSTAKILTLLSLLMPAFSLL